MTFPVLARRDLVGSVIDSSTSLLASQSHDIVTFAMGSPAAEAIPTSLLATAAAEELRSAHAYGYAATEGDPPLREAVLEMLAQAGQPAVAERLTITSGGMQGIDLACTLYIDPGDLVVVESPTYTNGSATALSYGAELLEAPVDDDGMIVEALPDLAAAVGRTPKVIYAIPSYQNPSGVTMSLSRRLALIDLAQAWNAVIIDDEPYHELGFSDQRVATLGELGGGCANVFSVRTFSKILAPGLRVGWVDAHPNLSTSLIHAKQAMDTCTNMPGQRLVAAFLTGGHLPAHLVELRTRYERRKKAMQACLAEHFDGIATWTDPDGGFFLWVTLPEHVDTRRLFEVGLAEGVAFIPGPAFSPSGRFTNALRLCFASTDATRTAEGVARLRTAYDRLSPH